MSQSREIAVGNGEILELRIEGEKRYRPQTNEDTEKDFISAGEEKNIQPQHQALSHRFRCRAAGH